MANSPSYTLQGWSAIPSSHGRGMGRKTRQEGQELELWGPHSLALLPRAGAGAVPLPGLRPSPLPELCSSTARARPAPCPPPSQLLLPCPAGMTPCLVPSPCLAASCCTSLSINTNCAELSCWSQGQLFCHLNGAGHFGGEKGSIYLHDTGWMFYHSPEAGHNFFHHFLNGNHRQCSQWSHKSSRNNDKAVGSLVTWECCSLSPVKIRAELAL